MKDLDSRDGMPARRDEPSTERIVGFAGLPGFKYFAEESRRWLRDLGFPIFVAAYLLIGLGPKFERLEKLVEKLVLHAEAKR